MPSSKDSYTRIVTNISQLHPPQALLGSASRHATTFASPYYDPPLLMHHLGILTPPPPLPSPSPFPSPLSTSFQELYSALRDRGAEILLVPSAFTHKTGQAHWEVLLRARAIENQCYVIAAAQSGRHNEKRESYGQTMIVDHWGRYLFG